MNTGLFYNMYIYLLMHNDNDGNRKNSSNNIDNDDITTTAI